MPPYVSALWFICRLVGVTTAEIAPHNRQTILRAKKGTGLAPTTALDLKQNMEQALFERLRCHERAPLGQAREVLDAGIVYCLRQYESLIQALEIAPAHESTAHRVLIREVWAPTIYSLFLKHHVYGLGNEFRITGNWYLPQQIDGRFQLPVSVLLDRWLRTSGLRTAYGITKSTIKQPTEEQAKAWAAEKKKLENWLAGRVTPTLADLFTLIDDYGEKVAWLDSAESWKSRFLLAHVLSKGCEEAEGLLDDLSKDPRVEIADVFTRLNADSVWDDDEGVLSDPSTYFAVRLWLKELDESGELSRIRVAIPKKIARSFGPEVSNAEIEATRREDEWVMKLGNHIAVHLARSAGLPARVSNLDEKFAGNERLRAYLLSFATTKLNLMISEEAKNAGEHAAPRRAKTKASGRNRRRS